MQGSRNIRLGLSLTALLCSIWIPACVQEAPPAPKGPKVRVPQQILERVHLRQSGFKGLLWVLDADSGVAYGPDEPTKLKNLTVHFYDGGTEVRSTLTSKRGAVDDKTRTLVAQDSVVVVTPQGERLETESLRWNPKEQRIQSDVFFRLTRGHDVMTGIGIDADPDLVHYQVHKQVRAEMRDEGNGAIMEALDGDTTAGGGRRAP